MPPEGDPQSSPTPVTGAQPGDEVAGVKLLEVVHDDGRRQVWRGEVDGVALAVHVLHPSVQGDEAARFRASAIGMLRLSVKTPVAGILRLHAIQPDGRAFVADLWTVGNVSDLPALGWGLDRRLELFSQVCSAIHGLHALGFAHGCLLPSHIQLDDDLRPIVSDVGLLDGRTLFGDAATEPYVAPELENGNPPSIASDVFALGQLLHFLLLDGDPPVQHEGLARLEPLAADAPAGLVRIVRRCIAADPAQRYATVADLVGDLTRYGEWDKVGVSHPDVREKNLSATGFVAPAVRQTLAPPPAEAAPVTKKTQRPLGKSAGKKGQAGAPGKPGQAPPPEPPWTTPAFLASALALGLGMIVGYEVATAAILFRLLTAAGFAGLSFRLKLGAATKPRAIIAGVLFVIGFGINFGGVAVIEGAKHKLQSGDPSASVVAVRQLRLAGHHVYANAILKGGDLAGLDFDKANFDCADFSSASLANSSFVGASFVGAIFDGADLSGATLTEANLLMATGFDKTKCDAHTGLPAGWSCVNGHPTR